jgi:hypothetical protein
MTDIREHVLTIPTSDGIRLERIRRDTAHRAHHTSRDHIGGRNQHRQRQDLLTGRVPDDGHAAG